MVEFAPKIALIRFQHSKSDVEEPLNALFVANEGELHNSVAGSSSWSGSFVLEPRVPFLSRVGAGVAAFQQSPQQLSVVCIGGDGQLQVRWRARGVDRWGGPERVAARHSPAPIGASIAMVHEPPQSWFALFADNEGQLCSARVDGSAPWQGPAPFTAPRSAEPGGGVVGIQQTPGLTSVLFVEAQSHFIHVCWRLAGASGWSGPASIHTAQTRTPPGAGIAAAKLANNLWFIFFVDEDGTFRAARVDGGAPWQAPEAVSAPRVAPPGAPVAAVDQTDSLMTAFVVDTEGTLLLFWRERNAPAWSGPHALTPPGFAKPGASVSAVKQSDDVTVVAFVASDGRPHICWTGIGWQGPARISWSRLAAPHIAAPQPGTGSQTVFAPEPTVGSGRYVDGTSKQLVQLTGPGTLNPLSEWGAAGVDLGASTDHGNRLFIFSGDVTLDQWAPDPDVSPPWDGDLVAHTDATTIAPGGFRLRVVSNLVRNPPRSIYHPFAVDRLGILGTAETPTGAFSFDGRCYVFVVVGGIEPESYLASSHLPDQAAPFELDFKFSSSCFYQVAPVVVQNGDHPGLPATSGEGLVMIGHGRSGSPPNEGMHLAWMPLERGRRPDRARMMFYAGGWPTRGVLWSSREEEAVKIFAAPPPGYTAVSLAWLAGPRRWILLYSLSAGPPGNAMRSPRGSIVARVAESLVAWSDEIEVFNPDRDGTPPLWNDEKSSSYGAFLLHRFTEWLPLRRRVKVRYLLSFFEPYQIQLMESQIRLDGIPFVRSLRDWVRIFR